MDQRYRLSDYDRRRQEELQRANLAPFWIVFFLIAGAVMLYLMTQPGW
jgi:fatty acid desaturase